MGKHRAQALQTELSLQSPRNLRWEELEPQTRERVIELVGQLIISVYQNGKKNMKTERRRVHGQDH
jgi:hypothetical protein